MREKKKKTKYFYVYIFHTNNFDRDVGVTLIDPTG